MEFEVKQVNEKLIKPDALEITFFGRDTKTGLPIEEDVIESPQFAQLAKEFPLADQALVPMRAIREHIRRNNNISKILICLGCDIEPDLKQTLEKSLQNLLATT